MDKELAVLGVIAMQCETQRVAEKWPHLMRTALWPNIDKVFVGLATQGHSPVCVSLDWETATGLRANLDKCIAELERRIESQRQFNDL